MKGKTHSTEEIIRILRQADGGETARLCAASTTSPSKHFIGGKRNAAALLGSVGPMDEKGYFSL